MDKKLWFRRKLYGWGWTPVTWEGWVCILLFVVGVYANMWVLQRVLFVDVPMIIATYVTLAILVTFLIIICYQRGEKPKWQWGRK